LEDDGRWTTAVLSLPVDAPDDLVTRSTVEFLFAYVAHRTRGIGGSGLSKVVFRHEPAVGGDVYGVVFEAVEFGGERNGLVMPSSLLDGRLPPSDGPTAERVRRGILRALKGLPPVQATAVQVREIIVDELMGGIPPMTRVASRLGMTMPVLAQLLRGEGETFAGLREQLLYRLALEYLDESELALVDVAFATGFVDFGVFERTFARWSGRSLASWRKGA
jgi:AraC-like DNA-binding protein